MEYISNVAYSMLPNWFGEGKLKEMDVYLIHM